MRKFPENPQNCNPVQLINQLKPGVKFTEVVLNAKTPSLFQVKCVIDDIPFSGQGNILNNIISTKEFKFAFNVNTEMLYDFFYKNVYNKFCLDQ